MKVKLSSKFAQIRLKRKVTLHKRVDLFAFAATLHNPPPIANAFKSVSYDKPSGAYDVLVRNLIYRLYKE